VGSANENWFGKNLTSIFQKPKLEKYFYKEKKKVLLHNGVVNALVNVESYIERVVNLPKWTKAYWHRLLS
jgi:hypothetical protein